MIEFSIESVVYRDHTDHYFNWCTWHFPVSSLTCDLLGSVDNSHGSHCAKDFVSDNTNS